MVKFWINYVFMLVAFSIFFFRKISDDFLIKFDATIKFDWKIELN
jgi:hypothetical protein